MRRFNRLFIFGVIFTALSLLTLVTGAAEAPKADNPSIMAPGLQKQLESAAPGELVTAIVKLRPVGPPPQAQQGRAAVLSALRDNARASQAGLIRFLGQPSIRSARGVVRQFWIDNLVLVQARKDVIEQIARRPDVVEVFDNYTFTLPPNTEGDPEPLTHQSQPWDNIAHIGTEQVWSTYGLNGTGIRVGGLDTGVDITHPDIVGKMVTNNPADPTYPGGWAEFDANGNIKPGSVPHDSDQHGTHTTGTMIGGSASGFEIGVAPGAKLIHGLVIPGGSGSFAQVAGGMEWIIDPDNNPMTDDGAQVVNMSLGAKGTFPQMIAPTDNMALAGVFPSFAIGNDGPAASTTGSPGNVPSAYGVGATDFQDVIASFSSRGPVTWNSPPYVGTWIKPDISAPGVQIFSSVPGGDWEYAGAGFTWSGTSMATPHVTGTVALMRQANPSLSVDGIKQILAQTSLDLGAAGMDNTYGWGRVNAFAAVSAALVGVGSLDGTVYSSAGGTVEGAMVRIADTGQRVFTDAAGRYHMQLVAGDHTVEFSRFGYASYSTTASVVANQTTILDATLSQLPSGVIAGNVTDSESSAGISAGISVKLNGQVVANASTDPGTGAYSVTLPVGVYDLVFNPVYPYPVTNRNGITVYESATTALNVELDPAEILLVDDDKGKGYETYYQDAIVASGRSYITVTTSPTTEQMQAFEAVVWLTGDDDLTTISAADEAALRPFLDGGGLLFISGQDIGYDIRTNAGNFFGNYLKAAYVQDDVKLGAVDGSPLSPVGQGFAFDIKGGTGANNQAYPDEVNPINGGMTAFVYDPNVPEAATTSNEVTKTDVGGNVITGSGTAAVSYDGEYRMVYFAFGFEGIANTSDRIAAMDRVLDWLQGFPEIAHTPLGDTEDTVNPYTVKAIITSDYFALAPATFAVVYSANGGPDMSVPMTATGNPDEYQGAIPAQPIDTEVAYYISASDVEEHTSTHPLGAPGLRHTFNVAKDMEPAEISHLPFGDTNDLTGPYMIRANVTDNVGVEAVYLLYSKNGGMYHRVEMMVPPSPNVPNEYVGAIPGPSVVGDEYDYYILAMDESYSGNVTREPESGAYHFTVYEEFVWDFEADDGDFTPAGNVWEWGTPTSGPGAAHSGVNLWATILGGTYPNNANATLDLPAITIAADRPYAIFSMWHWFNMENNYDGGNVKVSTDGGATWQVVTPLRGYDGTGRTTNKGVPNEPIFTNIKEFWQEELFDLSAFAGEQTIIRLHFGSDGSVVRSGWYVDDMRLRSVSVDNVAPSISGVVIPKSSFDTTGPYAVSARVRDLLSGLANVTLYYNVDGGPYSPVSMSLGTGDTWSGDVPGQPAGSRIRFYIEASDNAGNSTVNPVGAPASTYAFSILPSADILVLDYSTSGATVEDYRVALEANGHEADYWDQPTQGALTEAQMQLYKMIILENRSSISTTEQPKLTAFLNSGSLSDKKRIMVLGFNVASLTTSRAWIEQYMRAAYVQSDPAYREITGEANDPIGMGETFTIVGTSPDEVKRSETYPGGVIVYRFTGAGGAVTNYQELAEEYEKEGLEWDGVMPNAPISLDATAGMRYNGPTYRSVYLTFNLDYITEPSRRAAILDRAINWTAAPEIVHTPLMDTEDQSNPYPVTALVYSAELDPSRVRLTYDVGSGPVTLTMTPTGNPNEFGSAIPAQPWGTTVNYYLSAANLDGATSYHPAGAPAEQHSFRVLSDNVPPEIVHVPLPNSANFAGPWTVRATVTDNVGVDPAGVSVVYNINGGTNATVPMVPVGGDEYEGNIPGPAVLGDFVNYYINARDIAAVPNIARDPTSGYHSFEMVDFIAFDFEASNGGFTETGPDWEWGDPVANPSDAHSGTNAWATKLNGNYVASSNSMLDSPALVVPSSKTYAQVSFWQWYDTELNYDGGNLKISTDGGATWTILTPDIGYNGIGRPTNAGIPNEPCFSGHGQKFWEKATFNLTPYRGQNVILRWHFGSDPSILYSGWTVDDVLIEPVADDLAAPTFTARTIPASTLDTAGPYTAKATVVDFLSGVGSVSLRYSTDDGTTYTSVAMSPTGNPNEYSGDIPGQPTGTRIKMYFEATDVAGNGSTDPTGAPASAYQFSILPSGDYLVVLGGAAETNPLLYQEAFNTLGRTYDIWNWDDNGVPSQALLNAYDAVIVDESSYFDASQQAALTAFLDTDDGTRQQIFFLGRDMQFGSSARTFMEKYTGTVYVKDNPAWFQIKSAPGDPIGADETFVISGSYPDEVKFSTLYPGAAAVYRYNGVGTSVIDPIDNVLDYRAFIEKEGKLWDEKEMLPLAPSGPDSLAAVRYVGPKHAAVYFCFNLYYIQEPARRAAVLGRALDWLASTATVFAANSTSETPAAPKIPDTLTLGQNYPNPFNPTTSIQIGIPAKYSRSVSLKIYNVRGQLVRTVFTGVKPAGFHSFTWDGTDERGSSVASGIYFANFVAGDTRLTRKMVLLK